MTAVASLEEARAAKAKLSDMVAGQPVVTGIGLARVGAGWTVKVNVVRGAPEPDVPVAVDGVPVTVHAVGPVSAQ